MPTQRSCSGQRFRKRQWGGLWGHQVISSSVHGLIAFGYNFELSLSLSPAVARLPSGPIQRDILGRRSIIWASPSLTQHLSNRTTHALRQWDFGPSNGNSVNGGQSSDGKNAAVTYHFHAFRLCFLLMLKPCFSHLFGVRLWGVLAARDEVGVALSHVILPLHLTSWPPTRKLALKGPKPWSPVNKIKVENRKRTKEGSMKVVILSGSSEALDSLALAWQLMVFYTHTQICNRATHLSTTSPWNAKFHRFSMIWGLAASIYTREEKQQAVSWYSLTQLTWLIPTVWVSIFVVVLARLCSLFPSNRFHIHFPSSWFLPHLVALSQGQPFQDPWCHWCRSGSQGVAGINRVVRTVRFFRSNLPAS